MGCEAKTLSIIMLALLVIGIWDAFAIAHYMGSSLRVLAEGEGFNEVCVSFNPPKSGTILISYEIFVEPYSSATGNKYARLKIVLYDSAGNILWSREVDKNVGTAVSVASDSAAVDASTLRGQAPVRACVIVEKVTWGTLEKLRIAIKYNPYVEPKAYSVGPLAEVLSAIFLPFIIILVLPRNITTRYCREGKALQLILAIVILYVVFRYVLHQLLGIHISPVDYIEILFFIK